MIKKENFGQINGKDVYLYTLDNENGLKAEITNYGGIIKSLCVNGTDVVLGKDSLEDYLDNDAYFGAVIGRNSNRISNGEFTINGKKYYVTKNNGNLNHHGGNIGFDKKVWDAEKVDGLEPKLILTLFSEDGEEGFPGNAEIKVTYTLTKENGLNIHYEATSDKDTVMNLTNHSYFNLNGHDSGVIDNQTLQVLGGFFTPNSDECMPYGEILSVKGTPFDLREPKAFKIAFDSDCEQITKFLGYDHNFVLDGKGFRKIAEAKGDNITMEVYSDTVGAQIYTGNFINDSKICKGGAVYGKHHAFCVETQFYPNSMEFVHFPSPVLKAGEKYDSTTEYKFK